MSDLIVVGYDDMFKAEEVRLKLLKMQKEYLVDLEDAVVAVKKEDGKVKLNQMYHLAASGAVGGGFWGMLIGLIFLNPILGAVVGAGAGAAAGALSDVGIDDDFMKKLAEQLQPGTSVLFVLIRKMTKDKVLEELKGTGGKVLQTSLSHDDETKLKDALADELLFGKLQKGGHVKVDVAKDGPKKGKQDKVETVLSFALTSKAGEKEKV